MHITTKITAAAIALLASSGAAHAVCVGPVAGATTTATSGCANVAVPNGGMFSASGSGQTTIMQGTGIGSSDGTNFTSLSPAGIITDNGTSQTSILPSGVITDGVVISSGVQAGSLTVAPAGNVDMGGNRVKNVAAPTAVTDAANKGYVDTQNGAQDTVIATKASTTYVNSENAAQNAVIATKASTSYVNSQNAIQDQRLNSFNGTGGSLETWADGVNSAITAQGALLSQHTARLDEQAKGLAIAMAMPDAWLSDKQHFAIAGGVGGFGDETAIAFSAIGRLDETWSLNAGFGGDTEFKEFGWKVGARAGW